MRQETTQRTQTFSCVSSRHDPRWFRKSLELPVLIEELNENVTAGGLKIDERKTEA